MSNQIAIEPDTKDWTWVLSTRCDECGFDPGTVERTNLADRLAASAAGWPARLAQPDAAERPSVRVWSPLEYAAHVRDMAGVMSGRLALILGEDDPQFANWDQDATAVESGYATRSPAGVAAEIMPALAALADAFRAVDPQDWDRPGRRSNGSVFTAFTLGVYSLHDVEHHLHDVGLSPR